MGTEETGSDKARGAPRSKGGSPPPQLSALEQALRQALDAVPRDQVVKCIVSVLPATVFIEDSGRPHGGKARKVSVSMPEELAEAVRARTGSGSFSRYVADAVEERVRLESLDELLAELDAEYGPVPDEIREQTRRMWPDYQE